MKDEYSVVELPLKNTAGIATAVLRELGKLRREDKFETVPEAIALALCGTLLGLAVRIRMHDNTPGGKVMFTQVVTGVLTKQVVETLWEEADKAKEVPDVAGDSVVEVTKDKAFVDTISAMLKSGFKL